MALSKPQTPNFEPEFDTFDIVCLKCFSKNVTISNTDLHFVATCESCVNRDISKSTTYAG